MHFRFRTIRFGISRNLQSVLVVLRIGVSRAFLQPFLCTETRSTPHKRFVHTFPVRATNRILYPVCLTRFFFPQVLGYTFFRLGVRFQQLDELGFPQALIRLLGRVRCCGFGL